MKHLILLKGMPSLIGFICEEGDRCYAHDYFRKEKMTYNHVHKLTKVLEEKKYIQIIKEGRTNYIYPRAKLYTLNEAIKTLNKLLS